MTPAVEQMVRTVARDALERMLSDVQSMVLEPLLEELEAFVRAKRSPGPLVRAVAAKWAKPKQLTARAQQRALPPKKNGTAKLRSPESREKMAEAMRASWARRRKEKAAAAPEEEEPERPPAPPAAGFKTWKARKDAEHAASFDARVVVVRVDGKPKQFAWLVDEPAPGFYTIRYRMRGRLGGWRDRGSKAFSPKTHRIIAAELVRDATPRELELGYIVPDASPSEAAP